VRESDDGRGDSPAATAAGRASSVPFSAHAILNRVFLFIFLTGAVVLASWEVTPADTVRVPWADRELPETCQHLTATGRPCPSCGVTRSVVSALHGDFARSRSFHPAGVAIAAMLLAQCAMRFAFLWARLRRPALDIAVSAGMIVAFALLLNRW
jgi:hypothetical protein